MFGRDTSICSPDQLVNMHRLDWLGHVFHMLVNRMPRCVLLTEIPWEWKRVCGGLCVSCIRKMKVMVVGLNHSDQCCLSGCGPGDVSNSWLVILRETVKCCGHLYKCISFLNVPYCASLFYFSLFVFLVNVRRGLAMKPTTFGCRDGCG